jgi:hypothetical protein
MVNARSEQTIPVRVNHTMCFIWFVSSHFSHNTNNNLYHLNSVHINPNLCTYCAPTHIYLYDSSLLFVCAHARACVRGTNWRFIDHRRAHFEFRHGWNCCCGVWCVVCGVWCVVCALFGMHLVNVGDAWPAKVHTTHEPSHSGASHGPPRLLTITRHNILRQKFRSDFRRHSRPL